MIGSFTLRHCQIFSADFVQIFCWPEMTKKIINSYYHYLTHWYAAIHFKPKVGFRKITHDLLINKLHIVNSTFEKKLLLYIVGILCVIFMLHIDVFVPILL